MDLLRKNRSWKKNEGSTVKEPVVAEWKDYSSPSCLPAPDFRGSSGAAPELLALLPL